MLTFVPLLNQTNWIIPIHQSLRGCQILGSKGSLPAGPEQTMLMSSNRLSKPMFYTRVEQSTQLRNRLVKHSAGIDLKQIFSHVVLVSLHWRRQLEASAKRQIVHCCNQDLRTKQDCHCAVWEAPEGSGVLKTGDNICDASGCQTNFHQSSRKGSVNQRLHHHCCEQWAQKLGN